VSGGCVGPRHPAFYLQYRLLTVRRGPTPPSPSFRPMHTAIHETPSQFYDKVPLLLKSRRRPCVSLWPLLPWGCRLYLRVDICAPDRASFLTTTTCLRPPLSPSLLTASRTEVFELFPLSSLPLPSPIELRKPSPFSVPTSYSYYYRRSFVAIKSIFPGLFFQFSFPPTCVQSDFFFEIFHLPF